MPNPSTSSAGPKWDPDTMSPPVHVSRELPPRDLTHADGSWKQDMSLAINTQQLNRLRYLAGIEVRRYIPSHLARDANGKQWYDGGMPYLILDCEPTPGHVYDHRDILRSANHREYNEIANLVEQLDFLWGL